MSKEIAQTVGGKKIAWLIAILAAFAVFATLGSRFETRQASATVTTVSFTCAGGETANCADVTGGNTLTYTGVATSTGANGTMTVSITIPPTFTITGATCSAGGVGPNALANARNCLFPQGAVGATLTVTATVPPQPNGAADIPGNLALLDVFDNADLETTGITSNLRTPTLTVVKDCNGGAAGVDVTVAAGQAGSCDLTVTNTDATQAAYNVVLTDTFPSNVGTTPNAIIPISAPGCGIAGQTVTCNIGTLAAGGGTATRTVNFNVSLNWINGTVATNTVVATASNISNNVQASANITVTSVASVSFTKVASKSAITSVPQETFSWIFQIINTGSAPLTGVLMTDPDLTTGGGVVEVHPAGQAPGGCAVAGNAWNCPFGGTLPAGGSATGQISMRAVAAAAEGSSSVNFANLFTNETGNTIASGNVTIDNNPILTVSKSFNAGQVGHAGGVTLTVSVTNNGAAGATGVTMNDPAPAGLTYTNAAGAGCSIVGGALQLAATNIAAGATATCTATVALTAGTLPAAGQSFLNIATVNSTLPGGAPLTAAATIAAAMPQLTLTKSSSGSISSTQNATFTITATNTGNAIANNVDIVDTLPPGLTLVSITCNTGTGSGFTASGDDCLNGVLDPGETGIAVITVSLTSAATPNGTVLSNAAVVTADNAAPANASASVNVLAANLTLDKSSAGNLTEVGSTASFILTIGNNGSAPAGTITLSDVIDTRLNVTAVNVVGGAGNACNTGNLNSCVVSTSLAVGATITVTISVALDPADNVQDGTVINNSATVSATPGGTATDGADLTAQAPKLVVTKVASKNPVSSNPAEVWAWNIMVTNTGSVAATNVTVTDTLSGVTVAGTLPANCSGTVTCTIASLGVGASVNFAIPVTANAANNGTQLSNTASADCTNCPGAVQGTGNTQIQNNPVLSISKTDSPDPVVAGGNVTYTIVVTNNGQTTAPYTVTDSLPGGQVTFVSASASAGSCTQAANVVTCNGTVPSLGSVTITIVVATSSLNQPNSSVLSNTAVLTSSALPNFSASATAITNVSAAQLTVTKVNNPTSVAQNQVVTSTITVTNNGNATAARVSIFDDLPPSTNYVALGSSATCFGVGATLSTLSGNITNSATSITVASGANFVVGQTISIDSEKMTVTAVSGNTLTVTRGTEATAAASHNSGAAVLHANNVAATQDVVCIGPDLAQGSSTVFTVKFNVNGATGVITNTATSANNSGFPNGVGTASVTIIGTSGTGVLRHVDVDVASETASGYPGGILPWQDDEDDATGSLHKVCLFDPTLGLNDDASIVWSITPAAGSSATVSPAPSGQKSVEDFSGVGQVAPYNDSQANCVSWRSGGTGGQNITATHTVTGQVFYFSGTAPLIKEWNDIDYTWIVSITGNVTSPFPGNNTVASSEVDNWITGPATECIRDANYSSTDLNCQDRADLDGTTVSVTGTLILAGTNAGKLLAASRTYLDYTFGDHVNYSGAVDGVKQTYIIGGTCGSARVENPVTGAVHVLSNHGGPGSVTVINSDKGVAFQIFASTDGNAVTTTNAACRPGDTTTIRITSTEDVALRSDIDGAPDEIITINWVAAPPTNKQPILAWAGQRVVLEHDWAANLAGSTSFTCPDANFYVKYAKQAQGPGQFVNALIDAAGNTQPYTQYDNDQVVVSVGAYPGGVRTERVAPNTMCISTAMYESQDPGEVDISAYIGTYTGGVFSGTSQQVDFLIYYMKFESVTIGIVDGTRQFHNSGAFSVSNPWDASKDKTTVSSNVSADVLVRVRVKGWFENSNPTGRAAGTDTNNGTLPAGRWVMPDDWNMLAGGTLATDRRPNYDIMISPAGSLTCASPTSCQYQNLLPAAAATTIPSQSNVVGPFSLVDGPGAADSSAPRVPVTDGIYRQTWLPDRAIDMWDAPMPPAQVKVTLTGSGFIKLLSPVGGPFDLVTGVAVNGGVDKFRVYNKNPFYLTNIPAEPWISQINSDGSGYLWNSWGSGANSGEYGFWYQAAARGSAVWSAAGKDLCKLSSGAVDGPSQAACSGGTGTLTFKGNAAAPVGTAEEGKAFTGGYSNLTLYSDNHGEVMVYVNGDAGLTMDQCSDAASIAANGIVAVQTGSVFCEKGDLVGKSSLTASTDYPDKRKHYPLNTAAPVTIDWTWGGVKSVTLEAGSVAQFIYVVFHVTDRDGFCSVPTSQFIYEDINVNGTTTLLPLFVRTSTTQPLVTTTGNDQRVPPQKTYSSLPGYAGYSVPGGILGGSTPATFAYQATTTDTGFPYVTITGAYTLHSVLGEQVNFQLDVITGGSIVEVPNGTIGTLGQSATSFTFDTLDPNQATKVIKPLVNDPECQTWIRVSNSLLGIGNVLVTAFDPEGTIQFDRVIDFQTTTSYSLSFRWSLITWAGADSISVSDALKGTGANDAGNDIFDQVTAVYGWEQASQQWLGFFPAGVNVPGANDLTQLKKGQAYWIAIKGPSSVTWTIASNVN